jgi:thiol-disulfide isomerase/thioredoxin
VKSLDRILLGLIALLCAGLSFIVFDTMRTRLVKEGDRAPEFQVTTETGRTLSRKEFGGKVLVLNFWASWCPPCVEEMPYLDQLQREFGPKGVVILGVSIDKKPEDYKRFLARFQPSFETAHDPKAGISVEYGTFQYPETYVIDRDGRVLEKLLGPADRPLEKKKPLADVLKRLL